MIDMCPITFCTGDALALCIKCYSFVCYYHIDEEYMCKKDKVCVNCIMESKDKQKEQLSESWSTKYPAGLANLIDTIIEEEKLFLNRSDFQRQAALFWIQHNRKLFITDTDDE